MPQRDVPRVERDARTYGLAGPPAARNRASGDLIEEWLAASSPPLPGARERTE